MGVPFPSLVSRHSSWHCAAPVVFPRYLNCVWRWILSDLDPNMRNFDTKTRHKTLDVWLKIQGSVLDKLLKPTGQALLFPTCNIGSKTKWPQMFRTASCLCKAAASGIHYKNLQLRSSGSVQTNQVLWSKHWGVTGPPVWLYHDRKSWLDLSMLPVRCLQKIYF